MLKRQISKRVYQNIIKDIPKEIIEMLPESPERLLPYAERVKEIQFSEGIKEDLKKLMKEYLLSDEEYLKTFYYVMAITFYNKQQEENPKIDIVAAQTGSGKSNLTAKLLRENPNYIFVDSDKYKHFRYDAKDIAKKYPLYYANLTGPDGYDHASNIYKYAVDNHYSIIKETAPSKNKSLLEIDENDIKDKNYKVSLHVLAVSKINSILSVHERYELQILNNLKTCKLTPISRHNESYDSLIEKVKDVMDSKYKNNIYIYTRGKKEEFFNPIRIFPDKYNSPITAIEVARSIDEKITKEEFEKRYNLIIKQMNNRNALSEQYNQLEQIKKLI